MISAARYLLISFLLIANTQLGAQELDIKRPEKKVKSIQEDGLPAGWKRLGDDLFEVRFLLPNFPDFLDRNDPADTTDDPFSARKKKRRTPQQALEEYGIPFDELASASFDPTTNILKVINSANSIELIDVSVGSYIGSGPPVKIAVRLEVYEITKLQALQIQESAESAVNHAPERAAALAAVRDGNAKLSTVISLTTNAGQRGKLVDTIEFPLFEKAEPEKGSKPNNYNQVGTTFEVEPNINADGMTMDLNLSINYHTAPPEFVSSEPKYHAKSIVTNVRLSDGHYILIGNWTPTGKPEYIDGDLAQVAFITASIQSPDIDAEPGTIIVDEEEETE